MSTFIHGLMGAAQRALAPRTPPTARWATADTLAENPAGLYALLRALAANSLAYKTISDVLSDYGLDGTALAGLRNPTHAVASLYRATLWPGVIREDDADSALPLVLPERPTNDALRQAIHAVWRASNWDRRKQTAAYDCALLGDQVLKVVGDPARGRVWFQVIDPDYMTDLDVDGRGYLTYIRLDVPQTRRAADGTVASYWHTEVWDKVAGTYRRWEHARSPQTALDQLGTPVEAEELEQVYGTDFVPFVHWKHEESSASPRGTSALGHALDKIIWGDALVTALHQRLTNHNVPDKLLQSNLVDDLGVPAQPPTLSDVGQIELAGQTFWSVPGGWRLDDTVPQLDYANHLAVVQAHFAALAETDLPELAWYTVSSAGNDVSGRALAYKLTPAKARIEEARGNGEDALIRITQMALTVGQRLDVPGFSEREIGTWERGDYGFWIADREIVPLAPDEQSELETAASVRLLNRTNAGMALSLALELEGIDPDEAERLSRGDIVDGIAQ